MKLNHYKQFKNLNLFVKQQGAIENKKAIMLSHDRFSILAKKVNYTCATFFLRVVVDVLLITSSTNSSDDANVSSLFL